MPGAVSLAVQFLVSPVPGRTGSRSECAKQSPDCAAMAREGSVFPPRTASPCRCCAGLEEFCASFALCTTAQRLVCARFFELCAAMGAETTFQLPKTATQAADRASKGRDCAGMSLFCANRVVEHSSEPPRRGSPLSFRTEIFQVCTTRALCSSTQGAVCAARRRIRTTEGRGRTFRSARGETGPLPSGGSLAHTARDPFSPPNSRMPETASPLLVSSLLGAAQIEMALSCLGSLRALSAELVHLRLHDDGTLRPEDRERLAQELGDPIVVSRAEADDWTAPLLANRPALAALRARHPLFLKLVDLAARVGADRAEVEIAYCDTDILFRRPFSGLFRRPHLGAGATFMADVQNAYSVRSWQLLRHRRRLALPKRLNSGLFRFDLRGFDPDLLEWFAARPELHRTPPWIEQTAWALLAGRAGCWLFDSGQIAIPSSSGPLSREAVALHFVGPVRTRLPEALPEALNRRDEEPVEIRSAPASRLTAFGLAATEVGRRWSRLTRES